MFTSYGYTASQSFLTEKRRKAAYFLACACACAALAIET